MAPIKCPLCDCQKGVTHNCEVCTRLLCRDCCKRYLSLDTDPVNQVRACNECFLEHVIWDSTKTYDVFGPEGGKAVVLVHGALAGRQCLVLEARALADAGYRVIVPDLPAHGARFRETPLTLDNAVDTLHEVIQKEAAGKKVVMMGFSMGGYVAAAFAARYPDMLAGVLLGGCAHDTHRFTWQLIGKLAEAVYAVCSHKTKSQFIIRSDPVNMNPQRVEIQECFLRAGAEVDSWQYTWRVMYDADMRQLLPKITCPALLVVGEKDFRSHEKEWLSRLQHGQLLVLKNGIHPFMFQPEVCEEFRARAKAFTAEAHGEAPQADASSAQTHEDVDAAVTAVTGTAAEAAAEPKGVSKGQAGVGPTPAPGVGTVIASVLTNFWPGKKEPAAPSSNTGTSDGSLLRAGARSAVA